jgi:hypothetical protein
VNPPDRRSHVLEARVHKRGSRSRFAPASRRRVTSAADWGAVRRVPRLLYRSLPLAPSRTLGTARIAVSALTAPRQLNQIAPLPSASCAVLNGTARFVVAHRGAEA